MPFEPQPRIETLKGEIGGGFDLREVLIQLVFELMVLLTLWQVACKGVIDPNTRVWTETRNSSRRILAVPCFAANHQGLRKSWILREILRTNSVWRISRRLARGR